MNRLRDTGNMQRAVACASLLALSALAIAGCGADSSTTTAAPPASEATATTSTTTTGSTTASTTSTTSSSTTTTTSAASGASVEFLSPKDGTTTGPTVHAKVKVSGFQGGLRFTLAGEPTKYTASSVPEATYSNLPSGQHTLHVELVGNGNTATGVAASTTFIVKIVP
jgi:hypothetical protein